jgi:hypothetical protein
MLVRTSGARDRRFGGPGAYSNALRLRLVPPPRRNPWGWGMGDLLSDAQAKLAAAGYTGVQCRTERISLPMADPTTGRNYYDQNYCSAPGYVGGFQAEAVVNTGMDNLIAERAALGFNASNPGYFYTYGAANQVLNPGVGVSITNNPPSTSTPPASQTPTVYPVTATLRNLSRPGADMRVGDQWELTITGRPNAPISAAASHNGASATQSFGNTDGSGRKVLSGTYDASVLGSWQQTWTIAGQSATISFTVLPMTPAVGSGAGSGSQNPAVPPPPGGGPWLPSWLDKTFNIAGYDVPLLAAAAGAVGLFFMMGGRGR